MKVPTVFLTLTLSLGLWLVPAVADAETVTVKYRGQVELTPFTCDGFTRSSLVKRLCYDTKEEYLLVSLNGIYYHYCEIPLTLVAAWKEATSLGRFYNQQIKGRFDCRVNYMPGYRR